MNSETKTCQNCKQSFIIEPEDFEFYEKMKVPPRLRGVQNAGWLGGCFFQISVLFISATAIYVAGAR